MGLVAPEQLVEGSATGTSGLVHPLARAAMEVVLGSEGAGSG